MSKLQYVAGMSRRQYFSSYLTSIIGLPTQKLFGRRLSRFARELFTPRKPVKVFCVGWFKTGTTSFKKAIQQLGYKHCGWSSRHYKLYQQGRFDELVEIARHYDSFDDSPWNHTDLIQHLDRAFPSSKFVLLTRDTQSWARSYESMWNRKQSEPLDIVRELDEFKRHDSFVREYFKNTGRLLEMNVIDGDGYDKLAPFLFGEFPHENQAPVTGKVVEIASPQRVA